MAGRRPAPTAEKIAKGEKKCRINFNEPVFSADKDPNPPEHLGAFGKAFWRQVYAELMGKGVLKVTDRFTLEILCDAYQDYREAKEILDGKRNKTMRMPNGVLQPLPEVVMKRNAMDQIRKLSAEIGLSPSSRSKLVGTPAGGAAGSKVKDFLARGFKNGQGS